MSDSPQVTTFRSVLVANRGEIARRVIRSARAAGLRTIAVYSQADREAAHVREADEAVCIGPAPATSSYLSIPAILAAARATGAQAIHPGYGFLSERAEFASAVAEEGLVFIGPSAAVMRSMGRKDLARAIAVDAGVPVVPSAHLSGDEVDASVIGYPLLVKAAAGGGGKGMRIVRSEAGLREALAAARRESLAAFGDDTLLIERYVEQGRHIEVQILADTHGHVLHLGERDCSTQRRHQKVLEEAPAPTISQSVRTLVTESAVALARAVGYVNAGTVEFLVCGEEAYFLEMNTRLQVEHPVTELVTGLDLVALQLLVADGQPLPLTQADVRLRGHAIEARVYAEDPFHGFLPQAGRAQVVVWPRHVRVDAALESGQTVGTDYDPMLGKVIAYGPTRETARQALVQALDETAIVGLTTNVGFLRTLADSEEFRTASIDTAWLDHHGDAIVKGGRQAALALAAACAAADSRAGQGATGVAVPASAYPHPFAAGDGWRIAGDQAPTLISLVADGQTHRVQVHRDGRVEDAGTTVHITILRRNDAEVLAEIDGVTERAVVSSTATCVHVSHRGQAHSFDRPEFADHADGPGASDGVILAPMPGALTRVLVTSGQQVQEGDTLGVLEAMKMEFPLRAPISGTVSLGAAGAAGAGTQVRLGERLFAVVAPA